MKTLARLARHTARNLVAPASLLRLQYRAFRGLLDRDREAHALMARLEQAYQDKAGRVDFSRVERDCRDLRDVLAAMIDRLQELAPRAAAGLPKALDRVGRSVAGRLRGPASLEESWPCVVAPDTAAAPPETAVGGKAARLWRVAAEAGLPVPRGFAVTVRGFHRFLQFNDLGPWIGERLTGLDLDDPDSVEAVSRDLTAAILHAAVPEDLERAMRDACSETFGPGEDEPLLAVRSSGVGEDGTLSFAGQYLSLLRVKPCQLSSAYKEVLASKYAPGALTYRVRSGFLDDETPMAVLVLEMIRPEASGVAYSRNPVDPGASRLMVYSVPGEGEGLVAGRMAPDVFRIERPGEGGEPEVSWVEPGAVAPLSARRYSRRKRSLEEAEDALPPGISARRYSAAEGPEEGAWTAPPGESPERTVSLKEEDALRLAAWVLELEERLATPLDVEWCRDLAGGLWILQCRPLGLEKAEDSVCGGEACVHDHPVLLQGGEKAASGAGAGRVFKVSSSRDLARVPRGAVLAVPSASLSLVPVLDRVEAVVAETGSVAGHFASVTREWKVPFLVNAPKAATVLKTGETVTVDADGGRVFSGVVEALLRHDCRRRSRSFEDTPFGRRLRSVLDLVAPLNLVDPARPDFRPRNCRTFHDLLRFTHEKGVQAMISLSAKGRRKLRGARKLVSPVPVTVYVMDLGGGWAEEVFRGEEATPERVRNASFRALWRGLARPDLHWSSSLRHLDWEAFDRVSAGIVSLDSPLFSSFALLSDTYFNVNFRFGYHFTVVEALGGAALERNHVSFRFKGGGGGTEGRLLRASFLTRVLEHHGFEASSQGDWVEARLQTSCVEALLPRLEMLGFLMGYTRLLDMSLHTSPDVDRAVEDFTHRLS